MKRSCKAVAAASRQVMPLSRQTTREMVKHAGIAIVRAIRLLVAAAAEIEHQRWRLH